MCLNFKIVCDLRRDVLDPNKILNCLVPNEVDENEILHPKIKYTVSDMQNIEMNECIVSTR